jgi:hypothetical protein
MMQQQVDQLLGLHLLSGLMQQFPQELQQQIELIFGHFLPLMGELIGMEV